MRALAVSLLLALGPAACADAQPAIPASQLGSVTQMVGTTEIGITYRRPVLRGRTPFPGIVHWGRIWTAGADSATRFSTSTDIDVQGSRLPAGTYSIWVIPRENAPWTVIFNTVAAAFHLSYPEGHDALRVEARPTTGPSMETLAFYFPVVDADTAVLDLHWGTMVLPLRIRALPAPWASEIAQFEAADRAHPPPQHAVLFVGSSSIRMWDNLASDFPDERTINRGFGGSELADVVRYADRIVIPYHPRTVVLYAGDNDIAAGRTPAQVESDFRAFVTHVEQALPDTRIVFVSIKPSPSRWALADSMRAANARIQRLVAADPHLRYADVFTPMLGPNGHPRGELFVSDSLHMDPRGYALWTQIIGPLVRP